MSETSEMDGRSSIVIYTTCSACRRVVETGHVNTTGRCVLCAGLAAADLAAVMPGAAWLLEETAAAAPQAPRADEEPPQS